MSWISYLWCHIKMDVKIKYLNSYLGLLWAVLNPILQIGVYIFLFSFVFKVRFGHSESSFSYVLYVLSGMGAWLTFQEGVLSSATCISKNAAIVKNIIFPLEVLPVSATFSSMFTFITAYSVLLCLLFFSGQGLGLSILALPLVIVTQFSLMILLSFLLSITGVFYSDIRYILPIIFQMLMLITPIMYKVSNLPNRLKILAHINPMYYIVDAYQKILFYKQWPNFYSLLILFLLCNFFLVFSKIFYTKLKGHFEGFI